VVLITKDFLILIADDDHDDQGFIKDAFKNRHFKGVIECVPDGNKAIDFLKSPKALPGLILLDLNMPFKDGYEVLAEIKKDPKLREIPTVVLTSSTNSNDESRCYKLGCDKFLHKPLSMDEYEDLASRLLSFIQH
jgi:CheY-like chemotaxis protein